MTFSRLLSGIFGAVMMLASPLAAEVRLVMVEQDGCAWCARWDAEIAPAYPNTPEGRFAPLLRADLHEDPPEGVRFSRKVVFTPTFVLINNGKELARMEGYPGADFFWPLLTRMLGENTDFGTDPAAAAPSARVEGG